MSEMTRPEPPELSGMLPVFADAVRVSPYPNGIGPVERGVIDAQAKLESEGFVDARHAHVMALARASAHDYDHLQRGGKSYAMAQMVNAITSVFALIPQPEMQSADALEELSAMLAAAADSEDTEK